MRHFKHYRQIFACLPALIIAGVCFFPMTAARAQQDRLSAKEEERSTPAVDALKEALQASILDPEMQKLAAGIDRALGLGGTLEFVPLRPEDPSPFVDRSRRQAQLEAGNQLKGVRELRLALLLPEWRYVLLPAGSVEREAAHKEIESRFTRIILDGLRSTEADRQIAAATLLADASPQIPSTRSRRGLPSTFAPELVQLLKDNNPAVVESAARALGRIFPDPQVAAPALGNTLQERRGPEKRAAAAALISMIESANQLAKEEPIFGVKPEAGDRLQAAQEATRAASHGLQDADPVVRRLCAETMQRAGATLEDIIPDVKESRDISPEALSSLAEVLGYQGSALSARLKDTDLPTRLAAAQALMEMARALSRSSRRAPEIPSLTQPKEKTRPAVGSDPEDSIRKGLQAALPGLSQALTDADVRVRLAAVMVLDLLGPQAAAAAPALARALQDPDLFVRWAAARTLGNIAAADGKIAVPGLGRLLFDPDLDPRLAAAATLEHYRKDATAAVPDLTRAIGVGDAEIRVAVIHALEAIGPKDAQSAVPALAQALTNPDDRVRQAAAEALGRFGPVAQSAEPALRRALDDKETTVRKAASSALLNLKRE